jgi:catechol-2,3-dioxygenase
MPKLNAIVETSLYVDDLERAAQFYEARLGLEPLLKTRTLNAYDVGGKSVLLLFLRGASAHTQHSPDGDIPAHDGQGPIHMCFSIDREELAGWEALFAQHTIAIEGRMTWARGGESIYVRDPDGHLLELMTSGNWRGH